MKYISTRGNAPELAFDDVLLTGLAADGGLYVPKDVPQFSLEEIESWRDLSYTELAHKVIYPFVEGCVDADALQGMIDDVYGAFGHKAVAPLQQIDHNEYVLELFHGPTLAFKDFALQLLGRLLDYVLERRQEKVVIMGATSGDTGSAAIEGTKACRNVDIFILHPHGKVSEVQRRQMTTVTGDNIFNIAIEGNFDQAQDMVKASFGDQSFLRGERKLVAVNSINWARIMSQIVYYFYSSLNLGGPLRPMAYSVPTGNFGDIFAGYMARKMGLPIEQLIIATNENDVLHRLMSQNLYEVHPLKHTITPSMDIAVSSNFERLLFDLYDRDGAALADLMGRMNAKTEVVSLDADKLASARQLFDSLAVDQDATIATMQQVFAETGYLLDPHTAIGVKAARECRRNPRIPMITLGTAHPVKFEEAVQRAGFEMPKLPHHLTDLMEREERLSVLPADLATVHAFIASHTFKD
ncbi:MULTISPECIES: threonine synthase [unclassified Oceanobacter]|uniref:threonine synthase n=1 Tax=unclassified Oceanobacter TaxID=2620260 RepID=UPI0026E15426|nr:MULTISPECIES: threonine synthase [unclassified Oceanobacter]MDO6682095.1 threonine synthase [Oceanobacter sp. 5_MG-2023]MDP2505510.1 threonine synthase [Oceanobacter sp. 3_MG-2023]MDP2547085.1 threonine synthase [Oceanobacter sp. 4_MG-2023]MDP2609710.1 threonine synthase [Oceanobacter sp. 1_MG-2023]MDP2613041.1 threonine synthase [Oceanobacter sp. 2_MG-2023]